MARGDAGWGSLLGGCIYQGWHMLGGRVRIRDGWALVDIEVGVVLSTQCPRTWPKCNSIPICFILLQGPVANDAPAGDKILRKVLHTQKAIFLHFQLSITHGRRNGHTDGWTDSRMDKLHRWRDVWMVGWTDGKTDVLRDT